MSDLKIMEKPLHEILEIVKLNCELQIKNVQVAPIYIAGAPGGGKTESLQAFADNNGFLIKSTHFATKPLEENGGIPQFRNFSINGNEYLGTVWSFPDTMVELYQMADKNPEKLIIWFLDDVHLMSVAHNALMYELLTERKIRDYHLPNNVALVLAGNHRSQKAGAKALFSAIINRIALMHVKTDFYNWKEKFAIPNNIHPAIISFLGNDQYQQFFHEEEQVDEPWCSPREWTKFNNLFVHGNFRGTNLLYVARAHLSKTASAQFQIYYEIFSKFDIKDILKNHKTYELPNDGPERYALAFALISYLMSVEDKKSIMPAFASIVFQYVKYFQDLGVMIIKEMVMIQKSTKKRIVHELLTALNDIEEGITQKLIKEISDVD